MWNRALSAGVIVAAVVACSLSDPLARATVAPAANLAPPSPATTAPTKPTCATKAVTPGVKKRATYVWRRFLAAGYSPAATAGVLGNLDFLSAISPTASATDGSRRVGLAMWLRPRWGKYVRAVVGQGVNRWTLRTQTSFLLAEMADGASPGFNDAKYRKETRPRRAARYFHNRFAPTAAAPDVVDATRGTKAVLWHAALADTKRPTGTPSDNGTYGLVVECRPPAATLDRCPRVPQAFKDDFARWTGLAWDSLAPNTQMMSRCVYANFPRLVIHGTYIGHSPDWQHAIDFMMPDGCRTTPTPHTTSAADLRLGSKLARFLFDNSGRFGVDYLIWQDRVRNPIEHPDENEWVPIARWRQDNYNNGDCTNTHFDHVHASVYPGV